MTTKNASTHCQMSPEGAKLATVENHFYKGRYPKPYGDMNAEQIYYE